MAAEPKVLYEFGPFRVDPDKQLLLRENQPVAITPKAFDTLLILIRRSREVVSKDELMKTVWPDAFVEEGNLSQNIFALRRALGDTPEARRYIITLPGRGYRFTAQVRTVTQEGDDVLIQSWSSRQMVVEQTDSSPVEALPALPITQRKLNWKYVLVATTMLALAITGVVLVRRRYSQPRVVSKDLIVLADFENKTGDPTFDETLKQALAVQLEQSPFLDVLSDQRVDEQLQLMGHDREERLSWELARQVCQRSQGKAVLLGSISRLGSQYVIGLNALSCDTGDALGREQVEATSREHVLQALGDSAQKMREKLGESVATVQRYDAATEQATTPSLQALRAYSLGRRAQISGDYPAAVRWFEDATRLDPDFAIAYTSLASAHANLGESGMASESVKKAYARRERATERERFYIESQYYDELGDVESARQTYELWLSVYPNDWAPNFGLCNLFQSIGKYEKGLVLARESVRLGPQNPLNYGNLAASYLFVNRFSEARAIVEKPELEKFDSPPLHMLGYVLAFFHHDAAAMSREVAWGTGKPGVEDMFLGQEADTAAFRGELRKARDLSSRAVTSAEHAGQRETAATYYAEAALREALFGNRREARQRAAHPVGQALGREVQARAALAFALAGDSTGARKITDEWSKRFPKDTLAQSNFLAAIRAAIALNAGDPSSAIEELRVAAPYELGWVGFDLSLAPVYMRGQGYLRLRKGEEAAIEFEKICNHPGTVGNSPFASLAPLGLARAYALQGNGAKARAAYQEFLNLWKDADPDIPILKEAKAEFAKLH